jgi:lamin tail-like protein
MITRLRPTPLRVRLRALMTLLILGTASAAMGQTVLINEIYTGNPDYVEITNVGVAPVDVSGWTLESSFAFSNYPPVQFVAGTSIAPGASILILEANATLPPTMSAPDPSTEIVSSGFPWGWVGNSSGCAVLVDAAGVGRDLVLFGNAPCLVPGGGYGTSFSGVLDRSQNDPNTDNTIQRTTSIDTDVAADWSLGPDSEASPGALNTTQSTGPIAIERLILAGDGAPINFNDDGSFDVSATIAAVVTSSGARIENPLWDPIIGGTFNFSGSYSQANTQAQLSGATFAPASVSLQATTPGDDGLSVLNLFQVMGSLEAELGGPEGATPRRFRKLTSLALNSPQRSGQGSLVLDGLAAHLPTSSLDFDIELLGSEVRILAVGRDLPSRANTWEARFASPAPGQVEVGVINAGPTELYHLFVVNPTYALGTGPVAGIEFGPMQFDMAVSALGTNPFHVLPAADGTYHYLSPPGLIPAGWTLDFLAVRNTSGTLETLPPERLVF